MVRILTLETSTDVCSVALHENANLIKEIVIHQAQAHASKLAPLINDLLNSISVKMEQLNAVSISAGPGSYTGLRIGTSTAKGICYALNIPLIAVSTLKLLAFQANQHNPKKALLCPMIDARRMEVYCEIYHTDLNISHTVEAKVIDETSFIDTLLQEEILFFGNGSEKCKSVFKNGNASFLDNIFPLASSLGLLAYEKFLKGHFENLADFKPSYLKEFVAKKALPLLG